MGRDQEMLVEPLRGDTLATIGERHDLSPEGVRLAIVRQSRQHLDRLVLDCWAAQMEGSLLCLAVPAGDQELALAYLQWVTSELGKRDDFEPRLHYRPTPEGHCAFAIEDVSFVKENR